MKKIFINLFISSFFLFFLFDSCQEENNINNNVFTAAYAGVYDTSYTFHEIIPFLQIPITWDSQKLYGFGKDSIDLDENLSYDLIIEVCILNEDSLHLLNGQLPNPFPYTSLSPKNGLEIAYYTESYYIGLGQTGTKNYADTLPYGSRLDLIQNWFNVNETVKRISLWQMNPGSGMNPSFGGWYYALNTKYIGIRMNHNKWGWIEVDISAPDSILFKKYAYKH